MSSLNPSTNLALPVRIAQLSSIVVTIYLAGAISNVSVLTLPVLLSSSTTSTPTDWPRGKSTVPAATPAQTPITSTPHLLRIWRQIYLHGHIQGPIISAIASSLWGYVAYAHYQVQQSSDSLTGSVRTTPVMALAAAAVLTAGIMPYTWIFMVKTNNRLFELCEVVDGSSGEEREGFLGGEEVEARELVRRWGSLNFGRGLLPLFGGVLGVWAVLW